jgi:copper chaperone
MPEKTVRIPNISCGHCVATIEREVGQIQGVQSVQADQASKQVTIRWTEAGAPWESIATHLADIGYPVEEGAPSGAPAGTPS